MKYYSEEQTKEIRIAFEKDVLSWPEVGTKKMFGCPCYTASGKLFSFLVTSGVVLTKLEDEERESIKKKFDISPFSAGKKTVSAWVEISIKSKSDLKKILPYARSSYENAIKNKKTKQSYNETYH